MDKKKILVIDDEEDLCFLVKMNLENTGEFEVSTAFSGEEGIKKAKEENVDLVITDFNMPDMNGEEVINALKAIKPSLPVLLFSIYYDDSVTLPSAVKKKANGIICKPIDRDELHKVINDALGNKK
jgi:DNA-binding NtrC family response regulator